MKQPKQENVLVYGLIDPRPERAGELRYVGQSKNGMGRPQAIHQARCGNWQRCLRKLLFTEEVWIIEKWDGTGDWKDWLNATETFYITYFRMIGCDLTNLTDGGEGTRGRVWSREERAWMSKVQKAVAARPGQREKQSAVQKRVQREVSARPGVNEKRSATGKRTQGTPEMRARNSAAVKAAYARPGGKDKLLAARSTQQWREKQSVAQSRVQSKVHRRPEVVKSKSGKMKDYWERRRVAERPLKMGIGTLLEGLLPPPLPPRRQ